MNVVQKRKEIADWVLNVGEETLELLDQLKQSEKSDWWTTLSNEQKKMIEEGEKDIQEGRIISHEEVKRLHGL